jgi:hypothetical protein
MKRRPAQYPKYTHGFIDRYGKARFYLRVPGRPKRVPLPGLPWSPEFMAARERALNEDWQPTQIGSKRTRPGTVNAALVGYYQSAGFRALAESTQKSRRRILERFREKCGDLSLVGMTRAHLQRLFFDKLSPAAARNWKKAFRGFVDYCLGHDLLTIDPLAGLKLVKMKTRGHHTWTEEEIAQYRSHHSPGTKARLALELCSKPDMPALTS